MAYSTNPNLPKARRQAVLLVVKDRLPVNLVARKCGVCRSTIYRWLKRWQEVNLYRNCQWQQGLRGLSYYTFTIPTKSARPLISPNRIPNCIIERVLTLRRQLKRCAEVIWYYLTELESVKISLSSVRRILFRHREYERAPKDPKYYRRNMKRPPVGRPGDLIQIDAVHLIDTDRQGRKYAYTVIDLYSRMAYVKITPKLSQIAALETILEAETVLGFQFKVVQSDNGAEFGSCFKTRLEARSIQVRHSRPHRPNDNAHIERFNRTFRQECIGHYVSNRKTTEQLQRQTDSWLDFYNHRRVHLSIQCKTPAVFAAMCR